MTTHYSTSKFLILFFLGTSRYWKHNIDHLKNQVNMENANKNNKESQDSTSENKTPNHTQVIRDSALSDM